MNISTTIRNGFNTHEVKVRTENSENEIAIPSKADGYGSSVNGGELLFLALATCCCNDLYREAAKRKMNLELVEVNVSGKFGNEGEPASEISYQVKVEASQHSASEIADLIQFVDGVAEIHNTLRKGIKVDLVK